MALVIGILLAVAGLVLLLNVAGAADYVIARVTSRSLGELAPGFAASRGGFRIYATLVVAIGVTVLGLGIAGASVAIGAVLIVLGVAGFVVASIVAIVGEVKTYRALKG
jgi:hypothetical protein